MACSHLHAAKHAADPSEHHFHYAICRCSCWVLAASCHVENPPGSGNHFATLLATDPCLGSKLKIHLVTCIYRAHIWWSLWGFCTVIMNSILVAERHHISHFQGIGHDKKAIINLKYTFCPFWGQNKKKRRIMERKSQAGIEPTLSCPSCSESSALTNVLWDFMS